MLTRTAINVQNDIRHYSIHDYINYFVWNSSETYYCWFTRSNEPFLQTNINHVCYLVFIAKQCTTTLHQIFPNIIQNPFLKQRHINCRISMLFHYIHWLLLKQFYILILKFELLSSNYTLNWKMVAVSSFLFFI